jgi:predicted nucleotide-binding protein
MARRPPTPQAPQRAELSTDQLGRGIERLNKVRNELDSFDFALIKKRYDPAISALEHRIEEALEKTFPRDSTQYRRFSGAATISPLGSMYFDGREPPLREYIDGCRSSIEETISTIDEAIRSLSEDVAEQRERSTVELAPSVLPKPSDLSAAASRKVFIVHGHDDLAKVAIARFLEKIDFEPVILHEQANSGKTIIEKIELHGDVGFAVVLLTPDDLGGKSPETLRPRARQNVVLELGYFVARLTRAKVCALKKGDVEVPSDFDGVVYTPFDESDGWKMKLAKELRAAGHKVDGDKLMSA